MLTQYWEGDARWLEGFEPVYIEVPGWMQPTREMRKFEQLPPQAQGYIRRIEELIETPVSIVSTGPGRDETIVR
jgi:adenylosuccinate synthase